MKNLKKTIASLALAAMLLPTLVPTSLVAQEAEEEKGPFAKFTECAELCVKKYAPWTLKRSVCAADCYIDFLDDLKDVALA
jgi:hypothetical protein